MAENEISKLRADAPVFTPSFGNSECGRREQKIPSGHSGGCDNKNEKQGQSKRNRRRPKKNPDKAGWKNAKSTKEFRTGRQDMSRASTRRGVDVQSQDVEVVTSRDQCIKKVRGRKTRRNRERQVKRRPSSVSEEDTFDSHVESSILSPLNEVGAFPALSSTSISNNHVANISSTWKPSEENTDIIQLLKSHQFNALPKEKDEFSSLGLQRLSKQPGARPKTRIIEYTAWDSSLEETNNFLQPNPAESRNGFEKAGEGADRHKRSGLKNQSLKQRRPNWNMDRLRDRWWDAVALRNAKRNVIAELGNVLKKRTVDPNTDDDDNSDDVSRTEESSVSASSLDSWSNGKQEKEEVTIPSSLELMMQQSEYDNCTNALEILKSILKSGDCEALGELLKMRLEIEKATPNRNHSYLQLLRNTLDWTVRNSRPSLLMVVLIHLHDSGSSFELDKTVTRNNSTIMLESFFLAAELGQEECLSHFLNKCDNTMALLSSKDIDGNSVFHHCCRGNGDTLILKVLLERLSGGNKNRQQQVSKILLIKNKVGQTALHVACEFRRVDFVENFLSSCSTALLAKLLAVEDAKSQTPLLTAVSADASDVVMCLIMWRGNHNFVLRKTPQAPMRWKELKKNGSVRAVTPNKLAVPPCPLVWAAKSGNLDMILLLIQCSDPSGGDFHVTEALLALLDAPIAADLKAEGCSLLVQYGGNPFVELPGHGNTHQTAVSIAAKTCESLVLSTLVSTGKDIVFNRQKGRRKDPKLRQQPESFFVSIESKENFEIERALANALVQCLFNGWRKYDDGREGEIHEPLVSAVTLYKLGAQPNERDILRLYASIDARCFKPEMPFSDRKIERCYSTSYVRLGRSASKAEIVNDLDRGLLSHNSSLLMHLDWFHNQMRLNSCSCPWLTDIFENGSTISGNQFEDDLAILVADDGTEFVIHEGVVSAMSGKLASALRFDEMKETKKDSEKRKLHLDLASENCARFLQHIYHGSIAFGWSRGRDQTCREILELMFVAEEYLCHSLVQECEMRLLSSDPTGCFCWSCAKAVRCIPEDGSNAECLYFVNGPSRLVDSTSALDVLAILQHLQATKFEYTISEVPRSHSWLQCLSPALAWLKDGKGWRTKRGMVILKEVAFSFILTSFYQVIQSDSFRESATINEKTDTVNSHEVLHQSVLLLQLCLEEISCVAFQDT